MKLPKQIFQNSQSGFTLVELIVVMGILAILLALVLVAVNPAQRFQDANNTQRRSDVNALLNAIHQYTADRKGTLPTGITTTLKQLGTAATGCSGTIGNCTVPVANDACLDLTSSLVTNGYLGSIPVDPKTGIPTPPTQTRYAVIQNTNNTITVTACQPEGSGVTISVTR